MTCVDRQAREALEALFLGELEAQGHARLREHARGCADCREAYERLSRVESSLEKRVLPKGREALLEAQLMARVQRREAPARGFSWGWLKVALPVAACAGLALLVLPKVRGAHSQDGEWQPRAGAGTAYGVRAFCVAAGGEVRGEARPGETLACPEGASVQFSYTAPEGARLSVAARTTSGEVLQFFPREGAPAPVGAGVDVPLDYSTPVQGGWLSEPLQVRARFEDAQGRALGETTVTLKPDAAR
jgi:anti-sigma factor RsiW